MLDLIAEQKRLAEKKKTKKVKQMRAFDAPTVDTATTIDPLRSTNIDATPQVESTVKINSSTISDGTLLFEGSTNPSSSVTYDSSVNNDRSVQPKASLISNPALVIESSIESNRSTDIDSTVDSGSTSKNKSTVNKSRTAKLDGSNIANTTVISQPSVDNFSTVNIARRLLTHPTDDNNSSNKVTSRKSSNGRIDKKGSISSYTTPYLYEIVKESAKSRLAPKAMEILTLIFEQTFGCFRDSVELSRREIAQHIGTQIENISPPIRRLKQTGFLVVELRAAVNEQGGLVGDFAKSIYRIGPKLRPLFDRMMASRGRGGNA